MTADDDVSEVTLDWNSQAVWVQDRSMYLLAEDQDSEAETLEVIDQLGEPKSFERSKLLETHVPVMHATVYKSRYKPVQAYCPRSDSIVDIGVESFRVPAGDALVRFSDGSIKLMKRHDFNCRYQFVGVASEDAPFP